MFSTRCISFLWLLAFCFMPAASASHAVNPSVVAAWDLDDGSPSQFAVDASDHGHDGWLGHTNLADDTDPSWITPGKLGSGALSFAPHDRVLVPASNDLVLGSYSIELWMRGSDPWVLVAHGTGSECGSEDPALALTALNDHVVLQQGGDVLPAFNSGVTDGDWHHVVATFDLDTRDAVLYADGVAVASDTMPLAPMSPSMPWTLGEYPSDACMGAVDLDGVILWDRALSPGEVDVRYAGGTGTDSPYPTPELPTLVLAALGVLVLALAAVRQRP